MIPNKVIQRIIEWNEGSQRQNLMVDKMICHSLLLCLVPKDKLKICNVSKDTMYLIEGNLIQLMIVLYINTN